MTMAGKTTKPHLAKVDDYPERPYKDAVDKDADTPREQVDQIEDYHKKNPTLDTSGPEHDPDVLANLSEKAVEQTPDPQAPQD